MFEHIMHGNIVPVRRFLDILQSEKPVEEITDHGEDFGCQQIFSMISESPPLPLIYGDPDFNFDI